MLRLVLEQAGPSLAGTDHLDLAEQPDRPARGDARVVTLAADASSTADRLDRVRAALSGADDVLVVAADAVVPDAAVRLVTGSARPAALVRRTAAPHPAAHPAAHPVATTGGVVVSAATALHPLDSADADAIGVLYVPASSAAAAGVALATAATAARAEGWAEVDLADVVLAALVRGGVPVAAVAIEPFPGGRSRDPAQAAALAAEVAGIDEAVLLSRRSSRPDDGFYSTFVLRRLSRPISRWGAAHGVRPNAVTGLSGVLGVAAAVLFATGGGTGFGAGSGYVSLLAGALLLQVSLVLDCVDGEIARATRTFSAFGAWLDASLDRVKEYGALAGLAVGAGRHGHDLWLLALAGMALQTARHVQDFAFDQGVLAAWRAPQVDRRPLTDHTPWTRSPGSAVPRAGAPTASTWVRRVIHMPIAERWLVLSLGAALGRPLWSLVAYVVLAALAGGWTLLGALRRSVRTSSAYPDGLRATLARYRDDGLLELIVRDRGPAGTAGWLLPVAVTALEGAVLVAVAAPGGLTTRTWAFAWFAAVAWHRYDLVYRWRDRGLSVPAWVGQAGGGWLDRCLVVAVAAQGGLTVTVLVIGTVWMALIFVPESLVASARSWRGPAPADAGDAGDAGEDAKSEKDVG